MNRAARRALGWRGALGLHRQAPGAPRYFRRHAIAAMEVDPGFRTRRQRKQVARSRRAIARLVA
jgi:hypothetical protein